MVVETTVSEEKETVLKEALLEKSDETGTIREIQYETAGQPEYDYKITFTHSKSVKIRNGSCMVKWHKSENDWELIDLSFSGWLK